jgi:archaellum biogenesis ATPase FlaH
MQINDSDFPKLILANIVTNEVYCRQAVPFLKSSYFTDECKTIFKLIVLFVTKYNARPSKSALEIEYQNSDLVQEHQVPLVMSLIVRVFDTEFSVANLDWLLNTTELWCRERAINNAILDSFNIITNKEDDKIGTIPSMMSDALAVSFDRSIGHEYLEDAAARFAFYQNVEEKVPFDLEIFNAITNGGVTRKSLNCIMAGTGVGKTIALCHFAAGYLAQGKNVLYITMEMSEERIAQRVDANLLDIEIGNLEMIPEKRFMDGIDKLKNKTQGKLVVKEFPTGSAHVGHFRALLNEIKLKKDTDFDIICIDYLNICCSARFKGSASDSYTMVKAIAEEVRGLAVEFNIPIWSATQSNREGNETSDPTLSNVSESIGLPQTCDLFLAMFTTESLSNMGQVMFKQLKNRYNDVDTHKRFVVGIDKPKMRLYDVDDTAQQAVTGGAAPVADQPFGNTIGDAAKGGFDDFNF